MMIRQLALLLTLLGLAACAADRPMNFACTRMAEFREPIPVTPVGPVALEDSQLASFIRSAFMARERKLSTAEPSVLILSGGGKWGAYGAGLLQEWSLQTDPNNVRPTFDVVTGVSTGAMQATFAFVGRDKDKELVQAYSISKESELVTRHGSLFFLTHGSTADLSPLRLRARELAAPLLDDVALEGQKGRLLYVGTVDALDGKMYAINLTKLAQTLDGEERLECYTAAILASAAIPVVFRQITINEKPYYDAGVRNSVFITGLQRATLGALARIDDPNASAKVYILMNGVPGVAPETAIEPAILPTLNRLREITFDQIEQDSVFATLVTASQTHKVTTYVATAADHGCPTAESDEDIFNPAFMRCLIPAGGKAWDHGSPWMEYPKAP